MRAQDGTISRRLPPSLSVVTHNNRFDLALSADRYTWPPIEFAVSITTAFYQPQRSLNIATNLKPQRKVSAWNLRYVDHVI
jgi:hypothetical protein